VISLWYQNVASLKTAGHHGEAVASYRLPVASKATAKRTKTAFENAGFITHSVFDNFVAVDLKG